MDDNKKENVQEKDNAENCCCPWHNAMHGKMPCGFRKWRILKILLSLLILGSVFCVGVKLGELKGSLSDRHDFYTTRNFRMMDRSFNPAGAGQGMMNWGTSTSTKQQ
jgi:hypothetical protein